jgi:hypothetical protein
VKTFLRSLALAAAACGVVSLSAEASLVGPGESAQFTDIKGFTVPPGTLLAESTQDFTLDFKNFDDGTPLLSANASLHSQVLRRADGQLTFVYDFTEDRGTGGQFGEEGGHAVLRGFDSFTTDVTGILQHTNIGFPNIHRSDDGNTITFGDVGEGLGGAPLVVIATNATAFDSNGHATLTSRDEFPGDTTLVVGEASTDLSGIFQPIQENGGGGAVVPLPPAAYGGLAMLAGIVATSIRRRSA